jgi:hypothetical protein
MKSDSRRSLNWEQECDESGEDDDEVASHPEMQFFMNVASKLA